MVRWDLLYKALQMFGFGEYILSVVATLFNGIKTCASNAGYSSDLFYPSRGIRQGCCASPVLFVLAVELLAIIVRKTEDIKGITMAGTSAKISQYADDATFFLQDYKSITGSSRQHLRPVFTLLWPENKQAKIVPTSTRQPQRSTSDSAQHPSDRPGKNLRNNIQDTNDRRRSLRPQLCPKTCQNQAHMQHMAEQKYVTQGQSNADKRTADFHPSICMRLNLYLNPFGGIQEHLN